MRLLGFLSLLFIMAGVLTACNTTRGVGEDVSATGQAIQRATK